MLPNLPAADAVAVIIVAAGNGVRLGAGMPKAAVQVHQHTLLEWCAIHVARSLSAEQIVVVAWEGDFASIQQSVEECVRGAGSPATVQVVRGGHSRLASVQAGLAALDPRIRIVLVHDAARSLTPAGVFHRVVAGVREHNCGIIPVLPVADTLNRVDAAGRVTNTLDRSRVVKVQTPQGFPRALLEQAYASVQPDSESLFSDDASVFRAAGHSVASVPGDRRALKVTTSADLAQLTDWLSAECVDTGAPFAGTMRVGIGTDTHAFDPDSPLWVAGLYWPGEPGLAGHSDGDVVAHAIVDALLSAAGLGDIGSRFGTSDPKYARARGELFLSETLRLLREHGFRVVNVAVQLIGARPKISSRRAEAEQLLTAVLGAPVSLSATTTDGLGYTGRLEGLSATATALIAQ